MLDILQGCLCLQEHIESDEYHRITQDYFKIEPRLHRKQWEHVYITIMLEAFGMLQEGKRGIGFGCGQEVLVPAFAATGCRLTVSDQDEAGRKKGGWRGHQHSSSLKSFDRYVPHVCSEQTLTANAQHVVIDMNHIPDSYRKQEYDFVWSSCSLDHLGTLKKGADFVINSLECLRPGGVAVHTTEYNVSSNKDTRDNSGTVLYRKRDIEELLQRAENEGYKVSPMSWELGNMPHDLQVDTPPYKTYDHLKLKIGKYTCTSVGFFITK